ncbi:MAG: hypothetical protein IJB75_07895 [Oscillospiraceae bacterium]|nr:hypothetical protein [Oscillospiraceae bacterium]
MISLLLTACGGKGSAGPMDRALAVRGTYLSANGCTARMRVTADYGQRVYTYVVDARAAGGETVLTVQEPTEIAGVTARLRDGESFLEYDGAVLETGPLAEDGLTPMSAVAALLQAARSGFIDSCGTEGETLYILCRDPADPPGDGRQIALWFGADNGLLRGEVAVDGRQVIHCEFERFTLN